MTQEPGRRVELVLWRLDDGTAGIRWSDEDERGRVLGVDLAPRTRPSLQEMQERGIRVVVTISTKVTKQDRLTISQYLGGVDVVLENDAAAAMSQAGGRAILVSADRVRRVEAVQAGMDAAPCLEIAALGALGGSVQFCRLLGGRDAMEGLRRAVYYHVEHSADGSSEALAALTSEELARAERAGLRIVRLDLNLAVEDPVFVQFPDEDRDAWDSIAKLKTLYRERGRALVALSDESSNDSLPVHGAHGHFVHLIPLTFGPQLPADARASFRTAGAMLAKFRNLKLHVKRIDRFPFDVLFATCDGTAASFQGDIDRYSGVAPLDASGSVASRHILHADNARVVDALLSELRAIGYCAYRHAFVHGGRTLYNVIADLPGKGYLVIDPDILERIRKILIRWPLPDPPDPWRSRILKVVGARWLARHGLDRLAPLQLRLRIESLCGLVPWYPWWRCLLAGPGADLVLVGCHLDSTAASTGGYNPISDPAPGADDDASGIAATLAAARQLWGHRGKLRHTIRFCFFNAEEQGMIGSGAYASMLSAWNAPVKAVICADMVGYNSNADRLFEVHAGYTDPAVRDQSVPIANVVAAWANSLGALMPAQIYSGTVAASGADRTIYDGAINRSDHASFHRNGFPAVVVSEDFFANTVSEPLADPNPQYHRAGDTVIDAAYGSDIACAIVHAARELAS